MPAINGFSIDYNALNEDRTFSEGDTLSGKVTLALLKPTAVQNLFVKVKGEAQVRWTTRSGNHNYTHSAHRRYFKLKYFLITAAESDETVLPRGTHVYNFSFTLPSTSMPSTFKGSHGSIVYKLEAKLSRSWRVDQTIEQKIHFCSRSFPQLQSLMSRQIGVTDKEVGMFSSGHVHMEVTVDRTAYAPGQTSVVVAKINNSSSSDMTPKVRLSQAVVYTANTSTKHESITIHKLAGQSIGPHSEKEVSWALKIPTNQELTIKNCEILSVEYCLKVYLDISFAFDPEVKLPIIIIPSALTSSIQPGDFGPSHNSDFLPPAASVPCYPASPAARAYSAPPPSYPGNPFTRPPVMNPNQPASMAWGYNTPGSSSYGPPYVSSSSSVLHPPPNASAFHAPSPAFHPCPPTQLTRQNPSAPPVFAPAPSAPAYEPPSYSTSTNFLSHSDEPPPAYSVIFPPAANEEAK
ncbi:arrestin domain-containing protein 3-like [Nerophis lumbriciformis]|uniref:arrestin domain-containing protein 3-like n=1 Tax=Nerophis lumbriciformis TaxID=546530 RepID=UPI002ADFFB43|nr:arrestin domain-containing protein 3-like [Nerophis lumbriciformis]